MSKIHYLCDKDFFIFPREKLNKHGLQEYLLGLKHQGVFFVFFHGDPMRCIHCRTIEPIFKQLPYNHASIKFAMCNITKFPNVATMSSNTIIPIDYVPFFVCFVNSRPLFRYDGHLPKQQGQYIDHNNEFNIFLKDVSDTLNIQRNFVGNNNIQIDSDVPKWCFGVPYNLRMDDKGNYYLYYDEIYNKKNNTTIQKTDHVIY